MMSQGRCRLLPAAGLVQAPSCGDQRTIQEVVVMMCINTDLIDALQPVGLETRPDITVSVCRTGLCQRARHRRGGLMPIPQLPYRILEESHSSSLITINHCVSDTDRLHRRSVVRNIDLY